MTWSLCFFCVFPIVPLTFRLNFHCFFTFFECFLNCHKMTLICTMRPKINSNDTGGLIRFSSLRNFFFERFEFLVCSKFNHTQCGRACTCAVACLCPQNSNSNVVVSMTIHDDTFIHTYTLFFSYVYMYMYLSLSMSMYMYMYMYMSLFRDLHSGLSKDLKDGERGLRRANAGGGSWRYRRSDRSLCLEKGAKTNRTVWRLDEQRHQVKRMIKGIGHVPCSTYSQT